MPRLGQASDSPAWILLPAISIDRPSKKLARGSDRPELDVATAVCRRQRRLAASDGSGVPEREPPDPGYH